MLAITVYYLEERGDVSELCQKQAKCLAFELPLNLKSLVPKAKGSHLATICMIFVFAFMGNILCSSILNIFQ